MDSRTKTQTTEGSRIGVSVTNPATITGDVMKSLVRSTRDGFGTNMSEDDVRIHVLGSDMLQLLRSDGEVVGFASYNIMGIPNAQGQNASALYLRGIVVEKMHQGEGLFNLALTSALDETTPEVLCMRTQNPLIYMATKRLVARKYPDGVVYPSLTLPTNTYADRIGSEVARKLEMQRYNHDTFKGSKTYERELNDKVPRVDTETEALFDGLGVDRLQGDSILIVSLLRAYR